MSMIGRQPSRASSLILSEGSGLTAVASGAIAGGKGVIINSDGTVSSVLGTAEVPASTALTIQDEDTLKVFEDANSQYDQNCKSAIDPNNKNKVVYTSRTSSTSSGKAVARVGTISSDSVITFGAESPTYGTGASGTRSNYIAFDPAQPGVFVVQFVDENNARYGTGIVGTVASAGTGTTITWGSPVVHQANYTSRNSGSSGGGLEFDTNTAGKFVICYDHTLGNNNYEFGAMIGTISGTTLTYGTFSAPWVSAADGKGEYPAFAMDPNAAGKFVLMYRDKQNSNYGTLKVGTCNYGAGTISWGAATVFESSDIETEYNRLTNAITFLPGTAGKFVIWYNQGNHIGTGRVCTYSGTTIASVGAAVTHTASWYGCDWIQAHNDPDDAGDCTIMWQSAPYDVGFMKQAHISGTAITFDGPTSTGGSENDGQKLFSVNDGSYGVQNLVFNYLGDATNRFVGSYYDHDAGTDVYTFMGSNGSPLKPETTNLTMENFIGFCDTAVNNAATAAITSPGFVTTTQSGLTPGQQYYVQYDGTLALSSDSTMSGNTLLVGKVLAGTALTTNNLYVETSDPDPATKSIASSFTAAGGETTVDIEYVPGQLSVYLNGIKLLDTTDYTAINGTSIALSSALALDDVVDFVALSVFSVGDHVPASSGGTFLGNIIVPTATASDHAVTKAQLDAAGPPSITDNGNATAITIDSSENVGIGETAPDAQLTIKSAGANSLRLKTTGVHGTKPYISFDSGLGGTNYAEKARITGGYDSATGGSGGYFNIATKTTSEALTTRFTIDSSGHTLPGADNTYDLGSASYRWRNIYTTDLHLQNERGDWTVIEEEDYLTLRNNKTNKVYKLVMEEIE